MKRNAYPQKLFLILLVTALLSAVAACGGASPTEEPAPAVQEPAEPAQEEATAELAEPADEAAEVPADDDQEIITEVVEESQAAKATELESGVVVVSDEDVSTVRSNFGGDYRDVATSDAVSFHPYQTIDTSSRGYQGLVYVGGLLRLDENTLEYIPNMANSYAISEDGLTFTFNLRQDLRWSDDQPITAYDYEWTYNQVTQPENEYPYLSQLEFITGYKALDDYTLEIQIEEIYAPALGQMSGLITPLPKHIWEGLDWSDPETNSEINSPTVVSGPYTLKEWKRDQYIIFEANNNYWYKGRPNIDIYTQEIVPDSDIAYQKMKTGESDTGTITPENLEEARQLDNVSVYEWWPAAAVWSYIGLNNREGFPTHDVRVRHAINYAIDKQLLTDEVMLGQGKRICSVYPETSWVYNPDVPCYEYDPDKAIEMFEEAGYTFSEAGDEPKMLNDQGEQLTLNFLYGPNTSKTAELIAVTVQDYLGDIGVATEIQALEWASFLEATDAAEPKWDMFIGAWRATIEPHIMYTIWAEDSIPDLNSVAYINKDVEAIFEEAGKTYDVEFREESYQEIQQIISEDAPYVFLYYRKAWSGQNNRIKGIEPNSLGIGWNQEDWYIEEQP